jgi:hypothetical protein
MSRRKISKYQYLLLFEPRRHFGKEVRRGLRTFTVLWSLTISNFKEGKAC